MHWCIPLAFLLHVLSSLPKSSLRDDFQRLNLLQIHHREHDSPFFSSLLTSGTTLISLTKVLVSLLHRTFAYALVIGRNSKKTTVLFKVLQSLFCNLQSQKNQLLTTGALT